MQDPDPVIQAEGLNLVRNVACNTEPDIAMAVAGVGESRLYTLVEEKLRSAHDKVVEQVSRRSSTFYMFGLSECSQAICLILNISSGNEFQRRPIMMRPALTRGLLAHLVRHQLLVVDRSP